MKINEPIPKLTDPDIKALIRKYKNSSEIDEIPTSVKPKNTERGKLYRIIKKLDDYQEDAQETVNDTIHK